MCEAVGLDRERLVAHAGEQFAHLANELGVDPIDVRCARTVRVTGSYPK